MDEDNDNDNTSEVSDIKAEEELCIEVFKAAPVNISTRSGKAGGKKRVSISALLQQRKLFL